MVIKILGSGCPNCQRLEANAKQAVAELKLDAKIEKVTDMIVIMNYGIMSTPALVADEKVLSYGRIPDVEEIKQLLKHTCCSHVIFLGQMNLPHPKSLS